MTDFQNNRGTDESADAHESNIDGSSTDVSDAQEFDNDESQQTKEARSKTSLELNTNESDTRASVNEESQYTVYGIYGITQVLEVHRVDSQTSDTDESDTDGSDTDDSDTDGSDTDEPQQIHDDHFSIIAKVSEFGNVPIGRYNQTDYDVQLEYDDRDYDVYCNVLNASKPFEVYANGYDSSTEGSVSVLLRPNHQLVFEWLQFELICFLSVVDVEGVRRFLQSFAFFRDFSRHEVTFPTNLTIRNYVSRDLLLKEPSQLLPRDTLTLHMDFVFRKQGMRYGHIFNSATKLLHCFRVAIGTGGPRCYLHLDSPMGKYLCEQSVFFQRMLETDMVEKSSRYMEFPEEEHPIFLKIARIMLREKYKIDDLRWDIFDIYRLARKYFIENLIDGSRKLLEHFMCPENVRKISELADAYHDDFLRKIVENFVRRENERNPVPENEFRSRGHGTEDGGPNGEDSEPPVPQFEYQTKVEDGDAYEHVNGTGNEESRKERELYDFYV